jgi:hypothetical protein
MATWKLSNFWLRKEQKKKQRQIKEQPHYIWVLRMATWKLSNFWLRMEQKKKQKTKKIGLLYI